MVKIRRRNRRRVIMMVRGHKKPESAKREVFIALGSNLGSRRKNIIKALEELKKISPQKSNVGATRKAIEVKEVSSFYLTRPLKGSSGGNYINAVARIFTTLSPMDLLRNLKQVEKKLGRTESSRWGTPRPIDIDIIFYEGRVIVRKDVPLPPPPPPPPPPPLLEVPHPSMCKRDFVLEGLLEIAPDKVHPVLKKTVKEIYEDFRSSRDGKEKTIIKRLRQN